MKKYVKTAEEMKSIGLSLQIDLGVRKIEAESCQEVIDKLANIEEAFETVCNDLSAEYGIEFGLDSIFGVAHSTDGEEIEHQFC